MESIVVVFLKLVAIVFTEIFAIISGVLVFILFIPTKFTCPYCQAKFNYQSDRQECPECHGRLILDDQDDDNLNPTDIAELVSHVCWNCEKEFPSELNTCPYCDHQFDEEIVEKDS